MRWILLVLVAVMAAPSCAIAKTQRDCGDPKAETMARNPSMRVYAVDDGEVTDYRVCLIGKHKSMHLGTYDDFDSHFADWLNHFAISGRYLAFAHVSSFDQDPSPAFQLTLVDVQARRTVRKGRFTRGWLAQVLVNRRGEVGILASIYPSSDFSVVKFDSGGEKALDNGPHLQGLALKGRTLSWVNWGERRSFTFGD
jgi:hypothetical protein